MTVVAVLAAGIALGPMPTAAADAGKARFAAAVKRAASARAERVGLRYPPAMWRADCRRRSAGGWRCAVGTGGQCSGVVSVSGATRPRVRAVDVWCYE